MSKKLPEINTQPFSLAITRTTRRVADYVAEGDSCAREGFDASARAWWRRAGENYELAMRLLDLRERRSVERSK